MNLRKLLHQHAQQKYKHIGFAGFGWWLVCLAIFMGHWVQAQPTQPWEQVFRKTERLYKKGRYKKALRKHKKQKKKLTNEVLQAWGKIQEAKSREALGHFDKMNQLLNEGLSALQTIKSSDFKSYLVGTYKAADVYLEYGYYSKARKLLEDAKQNWLSQPTGDGTAKDSVGLTEVNHRLAVTYIHIGKLKDAGQLLDQALPFWQNLIAKPVANKWVRRYYRHQYVKLLIAQSMLMTDKGEYEKAAKFLLAKRRKVRKLIWKKSQTYGLYLKQIADNYANDERYARSMRWYKKALKIAKPNLFLTRGYIKSSKTYLSVYDQTIRMYFENRHPIKANLQQEYRDKIMYAFYRGKNIHRLRGEFLRAERSKHYNRGSRRTKRRFDELQQTDSTLLPVYHPLRVRLVEDLYDLHMYKEANLIQAEKDINHLLKLQKELMGEDAPKYELYKLKWANYYLLHADDLSNAEKVFAEKKYQTYLDELTKTHKDYIPIQNYIATYHDVKEEYKKALAILENNVKIQTEKLGAEDRETGKQLAKLAEMQIKVGDYKNAEKNIEESMGIIRSKIRRRSFEYADALSTAARLYGIIGQYYTAERLLRRARRIYWGMRARDISQQSKSVENLAFLYIRIGEYAETEELLNEAIEQKEAKYGKESRKLVNLLNQLSQLYLITGKYAEAEKLAVRASEISKKVYGHTTIRYAESIGLLGSLYLSIGDYQKAEESIKEVMDIRKAKLGENHITMAEAYTTLALVKFNRGDRDTTEVKPLLEKSLTIYKTTFGDQHPLYAEALKNMAYYHIDKNQYETAFAQLNQADDIWLDAFGKENVNSARVAMLRGDLYAKTKNFRKAKAEYQRARKMYKKVFNDEHPEYVRSLSKIGKVEFVRGRYRQSNKILEQATDQYLEYIKTYFPVLSEGEKAKYWGLIRADFEFYNTLAVKQAHRKSRRKKLLSKMYNHALATKALLLSSSRKVRNRILNSGDQQLIDLYKQWVDRKEFLTSILSLNEDKLKESNIKPRKIEKEIEQLEKKLNKKSNLFAKGFEKKNYTWKDVQKTLKDGEAAIEVIRYREYNQGFTDSVRYAALIVTKKSKRSPQLVLLSNGNQLENRYLRYYRNSTRFRRKDRYSYKNYWLPIDKALAGINRVYLSPDGAYNQVNVSSMRIADTTYVIDKTNVVLVSNTKDLVINQQNKLAKANDKPADINNRAVLFGNPVFYSNDKILKIARSASKRGEIGFISRLPGTEKEISEVNKLLRQKGWKTQVFTNNVAEEINIRGLQNPRVFHVATHGFFVSHKKDDTPGSGGLRSNQITNGPLHRSGLLTHGAGDLLAKTNNFYSSDGILTAYEAMNLNFDNTELVVLSACETGLGEVQIGEGVFGLQRSFLVAGADVLIMSLFKVSDDATQKLMSKFYKKWLATGNKRQAFVEAQKEIKAEYKDPIYWGAFNMMGID
ncbi:CHAT domain-containing tetratricopeptide repeat protein [uncultured Microscilla sp.]|uniref:CHAT domain-containing protein n=1 Tax=uncultured Microscilla sp. TaxID=432653 RepID=UPI00262C65E0|nr:CHAT domain-containing tetratricopeptide repeat protein [uncultured Microscilla sp.]